MAVGDYWSVAVVTRLNNQVGINVWHYKVRLEAGLGATAQEVAVIMDNAFAVVYKPALCSIASYRGVRVQQFRPNVLANAAISAGNQGAGTGGAIPLPGQVSGIITKRTDVAGRKYRGRAYIPFPSDSMDLGDGSKPTNAYLNLLNAIGQTALLSHHVGAGANTTDLDPVVYSRTIGTGRLMLTAVGRQLWATQRRRGAFGRANPIPPV